MSEMEAEDDLIEDERVLMKLVRLAVRLTGGRPPSAEREAKSMMDFFAIFIITSNPVNKLPAAPEQVVVSADDLLIATSYLAQLTSEGKIRSWTAQKAFTNPEDGRFFVLDPAGPWTRWSNEVDFHKEDPTDGMTVREGYEGHRGTLRHYRQVAGGHVDSAFFKGIFRVRS